MRRRIGRPAFLAALGLALLAAGFVTGWAASRRLTTSSAADLRRDYLAKKGDAPALVQSEVLTALRAFQEGYGKRDPQQLDACMEGLFPKEDHTLFLGVDACEWN